MNMIKAAVAAVEATPVVAAFSKDVPLPSSPKGTIILKTTAPVKAIAPIACAPAAAPAVKTTSSHNTSRIPRPTPVVSLAPIVLPDGDATPATPTSLSHDAPTPAPAPQEKPRHTRRPSSQSSLFRDSRTIRERATISKPPRPMSNIDSKIRIIPSAQRSTSVFTVPGLAAEWIIRTAKEQVATERKLEKLQKRGDRGTEVHLEVQVQEDGEWYWLKHQAQAY
ncbi:hypothetical protein T440DRAFT_550254 [Plenodomus tracheiphilus IPT5]|uniref:Uncharacterized protein n=1 Tax=Plenodomus tracheiphilus IPT5 TaxID=1408161 RepID=A0A6A7BNB7_9PLEO|nr:hypothetical protein T440DRAFT_550254 [Plenodomus tracheiphilus IPT5]